MVDGLATYTSTYKIPFHPSHQYIVEVKHRPTVPDNVRYWNVFGSDQQIEFFLQSKDGFVEANIDIDCELENNVDVKFYL